MEMVQVGSLVEGKYSSMLRGRVVGFRDSGSLEIISGDGTGATIGRSQFTLVHEIVSFKQVGALFIIATTGGCRYALFMTEVAGVGGSGYRFNRATIYIPNGTHNTWMPDGTVSGRVGADGTGEFVYA